METQHEHDACPLCGRSDCKVKEDFRQATRTEPKLSLGFSAYCRSCDVSWKIKQAQEVLAVA